MELLNERSPPFRDGASSSGQVFRLPFLKKVTKKIEVGLQFLKALSLKINSIYFFSFKSY
jgi:hypothetical protein